MTNPTSNYSFQMPTATDLVTDLPADFEVFGQAVDTRLKALQPGTTLGDLAYSSATANTNTRLGIGTNGQVLGVVGGVPAWTTDASGMTNPMTTTGDIIYSSSGSTPARLGIGTTGQVLNVAGGVPAWATSSTTKNYSLLNSGGTALTGAAEITVSGISGQDSLMILIIGASVVSQASVTLRLNGVTTSSYAKAEAKVSNYDPSGVNFVDSTGSSGSTFFDLGTMGNTAGAVVNSFAKIDGAATSGLKVLTYGGAGEWPGSTFKDQVAVSAGGVFTGSAITSIMVKSFSGNFDAGTVYVYGSA